MGKRGIGGVKGREYKSATSQGRCVWPVPPFAACRRAPPRYVSWNIQPFTRVTNGNGLLYQLIDASVYLYGVWNVSFIWNSFGMLV